jgi:hypothetical protein
MKKKEVVPIIVAGFFCILSIVGIGTGVYFYRQYRVSEEKLKNPTEAAKLESKALMAKVGKLMVLPNEEAQVATVTDVENLKKTQPFFQDAKDNDKLLLFPNAKKAVLYRESANVIVNVAPIIDQANQATLSGQIPSLGVQGQPVKISLRNGSGIVGITQKLEEELKTKMQNFTIVEKDNAKRMDYEKTMVISLSDTLNKAVVQQLANTLSATVSSLPSDEPKPEADLLIIAGKDRK